MARQDTALEQFERNSLPGSRLVNMYVREAPGTPEGVVREPHGGLKGWVTSGLGDGPIRGMFYRPGSLDNRLYVVSGGTVYWIARDKTVTTVGTITPGTTPVRMAADDNQLVIVTDPEAWIVTTTGVSRITDSDLPSVRDVSFINSYFVFTRRDDDEIVYALSDPSSIDPLDFATVEGSADNSLGSVVIGSTVHFIGLETIEDWTTTGDSDAPLVRRPNGIRHFGCAAPRSIVKAQNTGFWLGDDRIIYANPANPRAISKGGVDEDLGSLDESDLWNVTAWAHPYQGHVFVVFDIPGKGSWAYDIKTGLWAKRSSWDKTLFRGNCFSNAYGRFLAGSRYDGAIYEIDRDTHTDAGGTHERLCTTTIQTERHGVPANAITLECVVGEGTTTGQGSDPKVMFAKSVDGGRTFTSAITRSLGTGGDYERRVVIRRQGRFDPPGIVCEWKVTDPVYWAVMGSRLK